MNGITLPLTRYRHLFRQGFFLSLGLLLGRFSGFLREWMIAHRFSTTSGADTCVLMLSFPDLLNNFVSTGTVTVALYPFLEATQHVEREFLHRFFFITLKLALVGYVVLALLVVLKFTDQHFTAILLLISLLSVFPNVISAAVAALSQFYGRVRGQSLSTLVFNTVVVLALCSTGNLLFLAFAIIGAAVARLAFLHRDVSTLVEHHPDRARTERTDRQPLAFTAVSCAILSAAFGQIISIATPFLDRYFASFGVPGSVAALSYAEKLYMLPGTLVLTVLPYVATPEIFRLSGPSDREALRKCVRELLIISAAAGIVVALAVRLVKGPYTDIVFRTAGVDPAALEIISTCLAAYAPTLIFLGPIGVLTTVLLAIGARRELVLVATFALTVKALLGVAIARGDLPVQAVAWSTSIVAAIFTVSMLACLKRCLRADSGEDTLESRT